MTILLELRKRMRLTQSQFAQVMGVHSQTVSRWERGTLSPDPWREVLARQILSDYPGFIADQSWENYIESIGGPKTFMLLIRGW